MQILVNIDVDDLGRRFGGNGIEMLGSSAPIYLLVKDLSTHVEKRPSLFTTVHAAGAAGQAGKP